MAPGRLKDEHMAGRWKQQRNISLWWGQLIVSMRWVLESGWGAHLIFSLTHTRMHSRTRDWKPSWRSQSFWQLHPTMINVSRCPQTSSVDNLATTLPGKEKLPKHPRIDKCSVLVAKHTVAYAQLSKGLWALITGKIARITSRGNEEDTLCFCHTGVTAFIPTTSADILTTQHQKWLLGLIQTQGHPGSLALISFSISSSDHHWLTQLAPRIVMQVKNVPWFSAIFKEF